MSACSSTAATVGWAARSISSAAVAGSAPTPRSPTCAAPNGSPAANPAAAALPSSLPSTAASPVTCETTQSGALSIIR